MAGRFARKSTAIFRCGLQTATWRASFGGLQNTSKGRARADPSKFMQTRDYPVERMRRSIRPRWRELFPPAQPSPRTEALRVVKMLAMKLVTNGSREDFKFVQTLFERIPELRAT